MGIDVFEEAARLERDNRAFALASIVGTSGSTPRNQGRMLIRGDGTSIGTIGGGVMELHVVEQAIQALAAGESRTVRRDLLSTGKEAVGMECGGTMEVFIDVVRTRPRIVLVGGGHVNLAIAQLAALLDYDITVVEDREEFSGADRFPMARRIICRDSTVAAFDEAEIKEDTKVIIATPADDREALSRAIASPARYIGMLGSKRKVALIVHALRKEGVAATRLRSLHAPVGLDIGAETPAEIAVSVMAEILKHETGRSANALQALVQDLVVVRGAGDLATGCAWRLVRSGFRVVCLDIAQPTVIRRSVSFAQALFDGTMEVEGVVAERAADIGEVYGILEEGKVPVFADPEARSIEALKPAVVVDAILAKRNLGTTRNMAPITIGLGPGFSAGDDVDVVIETARGHYLGRVILEGPAQPNSGVPGTIGGKTADRVLRSPAAGIFNGVLELGDLVTAGQLIATVSGHEITAPFDGRVRGLLQNGLEVTEGFKVGDVDPRGEAADHTTISDKARALGGAVLEAILHLRCRA